MEGTAVSKLYRFRGIRAHVPLSLRIGHWPSGIYYAELQSAGLTGYAPFVVRPPRLTSKPGTGRYRTAYGRNIRRGLFASRADVAHYMLRAISQPEAFRQTVGIAN